MKMIIIGGSAGALAPLKVILRDLPPDLDAAVLVLRHSWPTIPSRLAAVLRPISTLPVGEVHEGDEVTPGRIHVAPSGMNVTFVEGGAARASFHLERCPEGQRGGRPSIDIALVSAAHVFGTDCIGVILSGCLDDGTEGAIQVGACDGVIIAQSPSDAEQESMPLNVIRRDSPEYILPDIQIAGTLRDLVHGLVPGREAVPATAS